MKPAFVVSALVVLGGVVAAAIFWLRTPTPAAPGTEAASSAPGAGAGTAGTVAPGSATPDKAQLADRGGPVGGSKQESPAGTRQRATGRMSRPVASAPATARAASAGRRSTVSGSRAGSGGSTPRVSAELAFKALLYVGVDPEAEKTWTQAINDPNLPEGVRSDLIEDLNDEGYGDPSGNQITKKDLPLILARMEIIERLAPYAMDKVNADAFEEAYKDLLDMYIRLGGGGAR